MVDYVSKQVSSNQYIFSTTVARRLLKKHTLMSPCELDDTGMHAATFSALKLVTSDVSENCVHSLYISFKQGEYQEVKYPVFFNFFIAIEPFGAFILLTEPHTLMQGLFYCSMPDIFLYLANYENLKKLMI